MPVALVVVCVMGVKGVLIQRVGDDEADPATISGVTVIVPVIVFVPPVQPPVIVTVYVNIPETVGVPLIVLMHRVCALVPAAELKAIVLFGLTIIVPVAVFVPPVQPPVNVTVYVNIPETVGVPLIVTVFELHEPVTPAGNPATVEPVASVVV
jgi:hypothetical protein